ncbi:hypothetical protein Tco_0553531, partial [Tanacetum coccineum]
IDQGLGSTSAIRACALRNFDLEVMELDNTQNNALAKLPMLKLGKNVNSWVPIPVTTSETGTSTTTKMTLLTTVNSPEDLNVKFLRSLPSEWDTHVVVWMNKPDFDTIGLDDLYNNFKIIEQKVKNLAFVTTLDGAGFDWSDNGRGMFQAKHGLMHSQISFMRTELEKVKQEKEGVDFKIAKFDKSAKDLNEMLESQITDKSKKGVGYEYGPRDSSLKPTMLDKESDNSKENTNDSLEQHQMIDTETSSFESQLKVDKDWKEKFFNPANHVSEVEPKKVRKNNDAPIIEDWVSDDKDEVESLVVVKKKTVIPTAAKIEKPVRKPVRYAEMYRSPRPRGNQWNLNGQKSNQL